MGLGFGRIGIDRQLGWSQGRHVIDLDFIDHDHHSWSVAREVVEGGVAGHHVNAFVFAGLNDLNDMVVARLLQLQVNTREFSGDAGAGISDGFNKPFIIIEIILVPIL